MTVDYLIEDAIRQSLTFFQEITIKSVVDSTNQIAKESLQQEQSTPSVIIADQQTAGYGRLTRTFYSPSETGIYMSIALPMTLDEETTLLTPMSAVAVNRAIKKVCQIDTQIKWVNDLYYQDKKVVGILAESIINRGVVIGIGINFKADSQLQRTVQKAGALLPEDSLVTRNQLINQILIEFERLLPIYQQKQFMDEYRQHSLLLNKNVILRLNEQTTIEGRVAGISDKGELILLKANQQLQRFNAGEIERVLAW